MDGQRFDKLTRTFATGANRRTFLKIFGGATVAGAAGLSLVQIRPAAAQEGDTCSTGTQSPCGDTTLVCCATRDSYGIPGGEGVCTSGMTGCQASDVCTSGTEDPCGFFNATYDLDYICCNWGGAPGSEGTCVAEDTCVSSPPNTGAGVTVGSDSWIAPAVAVGAAAAVIAYKGRGQKSEA